MPSPAHVKGDADGPSKGQTWRRHGPRSVLVLGLIAAGGAALVGLQGGAATGGSRACVTRQFEGQGFTVCEADTTRQSIQLIDTNSEGLPLRRFRHLAAWLGPARAQVRFAMNAGMYDAAGAPIGLFVAAGVKQHAINTRDGAGNFHMKPNGVFSVDADGAVRVETTDAFLTRGGAPRFATQSGPMLVIGGVLHPAIQANGASRYVRNGVGVRDGHTAVFVISQGEVSFGRLARFFRDDLHIRDALYFDGAVSSLWDPGTGRMDDRYALGPMVVVSDPQTPKL